MIVIPMGDYVRAASPDHPPQIMNGEMMAEPKLETPKFVRKPFYVDAVQVTSANIELVAKWCGGEVRNAKPDRDLQNAMEGGPGLVPERYVKVRVYRPMNDRQTMAFVGDWVLYAGKGYKVYTDPAFKNSFELIEGSIE